MGISEVELTLRILGISEIELTLRILGIIVKLNWELEDDFVLVDSTRLGGITKIQEIPSFSVSRSA